MPEFVAHAADKAADEDPSNGPSGRIRQENMRPWLPIKALEVVHDATMVRPGSRPVPREFGVAGMSHSSRTSA